MLHCRMSSLASVAAPRYAQAHHQHPGTPLWPPLAQAVLLVGRRGHRQGAAEQTERLPAGTQERVPAGIQHRLGALYGNGTLLFFSREWLPDHPAW